MKIKVFYCCFLALTSALLNVTRYLDDRYVGEQSVESVEYRDPAGLCPGGPRCRDEVGAQGVPVSSNILCQTHHTVQYSTVQYSTVQYSTVQYRGPRCPSLLQHPRPDTPRPHGGRPPWSHHQYHHAVPHSQGQSCQRNFTIAFIIFGEGPSPTQSLLKENRQIRAFSKKIDRFLT